MSLVAIGVRCLAAYLFLLVLVRLSGKRTVLQGTPFDFVVALILGDMIDDMLWGEVPAGEFIVATTTLFLVHLVCSSAAFHSQRLRQWLEGSATPVLVNGRFVSTAQRSERMNDRTLHAFLRLRGIRDLRELGSAHLEVDGDASALRHDWARPAEQRDRSRLPKK